MSWCLLPSTAKRPLKVDPHSPVFSPPLLLPFVRRGLLNGQLLLSSSRTGGARGALYRNRQRHERLVKVESASITQDCNWWISLHSEKSRFVSKASDSVDDDSTGNILRCASILDTDDVVKLLCCMLERDGVVVCTP